MSIARQPFGKTPRGEEVELFTLRPRTGNLLARIITYGAHLTELHTPDRGGKSGNIVLGFDNLAGFMNQPAFIGAIVGRYANRIARGRFALDGVEYRLPINNPPNMLHGGNIGLNRVVWKIEKVDDSENPALSLSHVSPAGEDGFPGTLRVTVGYTLTNDSLRIDYSASTDAQTTVNLTSHCYFNLRGPGSGDILGHELLLNASNFTPVDDTLIPTGRIATVKDTPFDFTTPRLIGQRIREVPGKIGGYDHNYVLDTGGDVSKLAVRLREPTSGREMEMFTTEPGMQFYAGLNLDGSIKGIGGAYNRFGALCLEAQHFPDSPNHPNFPSTILRPGQTYRQTTIHRFTTDRKP
jgi:aldose 1-epimerase